MRIDSKRFERAINYQCKNLGVTKRDLEVEICGFAEGTIRRQIRDGIIGKQSFERLRKAAIEPTAFEIKQDKQLTIDDLAKKEGVSIHISKKTNERLRDFCERTNMRKDAMADSIISDWLDKKKEERIKKLEEEASIEELEEALRRKKA